MSIFTLMWQRQIRRVFKSCPAATLVARFSPYSKENIVIVTERNALAFLALHEEMHIAIYAMRGVADNRGIHYASRRFWTIDFRLCKQAKF
ncbi:hypothetical protein H6H02_05960 [Coleofasciculus sp. FACHB-1120]|nr:hypothetical protein [Coleofasciculus sp. FACHB-1120]